MSSGYTEEERNQFIKDVMSGKIKKKDRKESLLVSIQYNDEEFQKINNEEYEFMEKYGDMDDDEIIKIVGKEYNDRINLIIDLVSQITSLQLQVLRNAGIKISREIINSHIKENKRLDKKMQEKLLESSYQKKKIGK
jgi:hypothetical protein